MIGIVKSDYIYRQDSEVVMLKLSYNE